MAPEAIVIRRTSARDWNTVIDIYNHPKYGCATHALIGEDGSLTQIAPLNRCVNPHIELPHIELTLVNAGQLLEVGAIYKTWYGKQIKSDDVYVDDTETAWQAFPDVQIEALAMVIEAIFDELGPLPIYGADEVGVYVGPNPGGALKFELLRQRFGLYPIPLYVTTAITPIFTEPMAAADQLMPPLPPGVNVTLESEGRYGWMQISTVAQLDGERLNVCGWVRRQHLAPTIPSQAEFDPKAGWDDLKPSDFET